MQDGEYVWIGEDVGRFDLRGDWHLDVAVWIGFAGFDALAVFVRASGWRNGTDVGRGSIPTPDQIEESADLNVGAEKCEKDRSGNEQKGQNDGDRIFQRERPDFLEHALDGKLKAHTVWIFMTPPKI